MKKIGKRIEDIPVISVWRLKREFTDCRVVVWGTFGEVAIKKIVMQLNDVISEENIYVVPLYIAMNKEISHIDENGLVPFRLWVQIDALGIKMTNHCNLNCIRCNNFSNISQPDAYSPEELERDMARLSSLIPDVLNIKLIGGEPLLNTEIAECIQVVKKYYPYSHYSLVTNGLLIKALSGEILQCLKENHIVVAMTLYPALQEQVDEIAEKLVENGIAFAIYRSGDYFIPILNEEGKYSPEYVNRQDKTKCVSFYKGNICRCTPGLNISTYNQKFQKAFPESGIINIYERDMTGEQLMKKLDEPLELCRFCNGCLPLDEKEYGKKWALGEAKREDWLIC